MSNKYGYIRISEQDESFDVQLAALEKENCDHIYIDRGLSDAEGAQSEFTALKRKIKSGDTLVIWRLDRLGGSLRYLVDTMEELIESKVHFVALTENLDTSTTEGKHLFRLISGLAEFERSLNSERARAGAAAARAKGKPLGRRRALSDAQHQEVLRLLDEEVSYDDIARIYSVHPRTIRRIKAEYAKEEA